MNSNRLNRHAEHGLAENQPTMAQYLQVQEEMLAKWGWIIHYVPEDGGWINCHTHGLPKKHGHPDLQIVMPLSQDTAGAILHGVVDRIAAGERFAAGMEVDGIILHYRVRIVNAIECGREVLRIVFPAQDGSFDTHPYSRQETVQFFHPERN